MALIGVDLGACDSGAAVPGGDGPVMVPSSEGPATRGKGFPSYVAVDAKGRLLRGERARRQAPDNPGGTVRTFKEALGSERLFTLRERELSAQTLAAELLGKVRRAAETFTGEAVEGAAVAVPAHFIEVQRRALVRAAEAAGLGRVALVEEPQAAALGCGLDRLEPGLRVVVMDFGCASLDVSVVETGLRSCTVRATLGEPALSGLAMDEWLLDYVIMRHCYEHGLDIARDGAALPRLCQAVQAVREALSEQQEAHLVLPNLAVLDGSLIQMDRLLTRQELERLLEPMLGRCRGLAERVLERAGAGLEDVQRYVLIGGVTAMPRVAQVLGALFPNAEPLEADPLTCIARGAARHAATAVEPQGA
jgi:molecular chaperone DnaK